jgi:hypothetical protein
MLDYICAKRKRMKKIATILVIALVALKGQSQGVINTMKSSPWTFSLGWAAIDDDGKKFEGLLNAKDSWNYNLFPAQIGASKKMTNKLNLNMTFAYVNYDAKNRNGENAYQEGTFWALDANTQYSLIKIKGLDIQTIQGIGFTKRDPGLDPNMATLNTGLSFNYWVKENWGIALHSQAKWGLSNISDGGSYLHHGISLFYVAK